MIINQLRTPPGASKVDFQRVDVDDRWPVTAGHDEKKASLKNVMPGLTGHLSFVIPGLTRNLKTFKLKVKYFILLKIRKEFGYFGKRLYLCYGH